MTDTQHTHKVIIKKNHWISPLWFLPFVALLIAAWLGYQSYSESGHRILIHFHSANGITAGRTPIRYHGLEVGKVKNLHLSSDLDSVFVEATIYPEAAETLKEDTEFWLEKPRASITGISGLDTIVSGNYIGLKPGKSDKYSDEFTALDKPIIEKPDPDGISIQVVTDSLDSLHIGSLVYFNRFPVGQVYHYEINKITKKILIDLMIKKNYKNLIKNNSRFWNISGISADISFDNIQVKADGLASVIMGGIAFDSPKDGQIITEPHQPFTLYSDYKSIAKNTFNTTEDSRITLYADQSYHISTDSLISYLGLEVGKVINVKLTSNNKVAIDIEIQKKYAHLITAQTSFFVDSGLHADFSKANLDVRLPNLKQLMLGNISFISKGTGKAQSSYPLLSNKRLAQLAQNNTMGHKIYKLTSDQLFGLHAGSPVLYHGLTVGEVLNFSLVDSAFQIKIAINKAYTHLIGAKTAFWNASGLQVKASLSGVNVNTSSLRSLIQGGIAFDSILPTRVKTKGLYPLYASEEQIINFGQKIHISTTDIGGLKQGAKIKYLKVPIGEITKITPNLYKKNVDISARLYPEYSRIFSRMDTQYYLVAPSLTFRGVKNPDAVFDVYIGATPGNKKQTSYQFQLGNMAQAQAEGKVFVLETDRRDSLKTDSPVYYRDVEVGHVTKIELGKLSDRVLIFIHIKDKYTYLVRKNSVFWNMSGVDMNFSLGGARLQTGTIDTLMMGGISFATPDIQHFMLSRSVNPKWRSWRTAIPKE